MSELLLNQFEQDRALVALRYKNLNIRKLFGKSVFYSRRRRTRLFSCIIASHG